MSVEIYSLFQIGFDNLENKSTYEQKLLGMFITDEKGTAHKKCGDFIRDMQIPKFYFGWDGGVYPKFRVDKGYAK